MEYLTNKCIHVCGMNRSGQHAISDWLLLCFKNGLYKNNVGFHVNGLEATPLFRINHNPRSIKWRYRYVKDGVGSGNGIRYLNEDFSSIRNVIIYGSEMVSPETFMNGYNSLYIKNEIELIKILKEQNKNYYDLKGIGKNNLFIFVLRSPWNNASSGLFWRKRSHMMNNINFFSKIWVETAKEFIGETNFIKNNFIPIIYDKWVSDIEYKKSICEKIGVDFLYNETSKVSHYGGGSSFSDGGTSISLSTLNRWEKCLPIPKFNKHLKELLSNNELLYYSNILFGPPPNIS